MEPHPEDSAEVEIPYSTICRRNCRIIAPIPYKTKIKTNNSLLCPIGRAEPSFPWAQKMVKICTNNQAVRVKSNLCTTQKYQICPWIWKSWTKKVTSEFSKMCLTPKRNCWTFRDEISHQIKPIPNREWAKIRCQKWVGWQNWTHCAMWPAR